MSTIEAPELITPQLLRGWALPEPGGSKYARGRVLVVGGSAGTPGAVMLAGLAALRMGAGRLSLVVDGAVAAHVAVAVPESGVSALDDDERLAEEASAADAVLVGPGIGDAEVAIGLLERLAEVVGKDVPVVVDAFAATSLPECSTSALTALGGRLLATPNPGEAARLVGVDDELEGEALGRAARQVHEEYDATVAAGGWVVADDGVWRATTGDTGLGTSGSGDVLAGAITGLLARGAGHAQAVAWGVHSHAAAGDALAARMGRVGYLARELVDELPLVLGSLRGD